jgi:hypothetical protein
LVKASAEFSSAERAEFTAVSISVNTAGRVVGGSVGSGTVVDTIVVDAAEVGTTVVVAAEPW